VVGYESSILTDAHQELHVYIFEVCAIHRIEMKISALKLVLYAAPLHQELVSSLHAV
jgi:hypothetical protein